MIPLVLRVWARVGGAEGDVGERGRLGRPRAAADCFERLPDELAVRKDGVDVTPIDVKLANALDVFSLANDANDRRLLLCVMLSELECWCPAREASRVTLPTEAGRGWLPGEVF